MADFLDEKRKEIQARTEGTEAAGRGVHPPRGSGARTVGCRHQRQPPPAPPASAPARRRRASGGGSGTGRRGRPRGSGTRAVQAFELVKARPGITIPELAESMGIKQNYLYRVMPTLAEEGKVTKSGRGWHARGE